MKLSLPYRTLFALALGGFVYVAFRKSWLFGFLALPLALITFSAIQWGASLLAFGLKTATLPARTAISATRRRRP